MRYVMTGLIMTVTEQQMSLIAIASVHQGVSLSIMCVFRYIRVVRNYVQKDVSASMDCVYLAVMEVMKRSVTGHA
jgi:hypothetical protein